MKKKEEPNQKSEQIKRVNPQAVMGMMAIEIETLILQLIKKGVIDKKDYQKAVGKRLESFIKTGVVEHALSCETSPQEKVDTRYIG